MKKIVLFFKKLAYVAIAFIISSGFSSCRDDEDTAQISLFGKVVSSKDNVHNGEEIFLSIGNVNIGGSVGIGVQNGTTINGKEIGIPRVHYYVDNKEVGDSNDKSTQFQIKYTVTGLSVGSHTVYATAEPQEKGTTFIGSYTSSTFNVIEE